jgi:hypothetical protein
MADQSVKITNLPDSGSPARVAYNLMEKIAQDEFYERGSKDPENPREYYLKLYAACRTETGY